MADTEKLTTKFFRGYYKVLFISLLASTALVILSPVFAFEAKLIYEVFRFIFNLW